MTFTSFTFAAFLLLVFCGYWSLARRRDQNVLLVGASYLFYGWWDFRFCGLLLLSSVIDYAAGRALGVVEGARARRAVLWVSLVSNLGILAAFKYYGFFADSLQALAASAGVRLSVVELNLVLPVGISFYTFQSLNYTIDVYRRQLEPSRSLVDFLAFVAYFPHLVAGPINRARDLLSQIAANRRFNLDQAVDGCRQMLWGALKKTVVADNLAPLVDAAYADPSAMTGPQLALAAVCFAVQIYCDFSGYSDIAIGCSNLFGIRLMRNFAYPFFSRSPSEFWRRWHISLSTWFRDYVYVPLGGRQGGFAGQASAVMITFFLSGLWHGAAWHFVVWGVLNGAALIAERFWSRLRTGSVPAPLQVLGTFAFFAFGLIFFRAQSVPEALFIVRRIAGSSYALGDWAPVGATLMSSAAAVTATVVLFVLEYVNRRHPHPLVFPAGVHFPGGAWVMRPVRWAVYTMIVLGICEYGPFRGRDFIYFQF